MTSTEGPAAAQAETPADRAVNVAETRGNILAGWDNPWPPSDAPAWALAYYEQEAGR